MPLLTTHQLVCGYDTPLVGPLDLELPAGRFLLVEGPNGIGKSTVLKTVVGLLEPISGGYEWSVPSGERRFVPQVRTLDPVLPATVHDVVATGGLSGGSLAALRRTADRRRVEDALEHVEMAGRADDLFRDLSEGQKQLVLLARSLMGEAGAVVLDEPTASMDPGREAHAIELLEERRRLDGLAVLLIAHGSRAARRAADARLVIDEDRNVEVEV